MKVVILISIFLLSFNRSCAQTVPKEPIKQEQTIKITSALIQDGYEIFSVVEAKRPIAENVYLLAKRGETQLKIQDTAEFAQLVRGIASKEAALEFVRLLTAQEIRPFLRDVYYSEVHKKEGEKDQWFAIEPTQYEQWNLHDPVVTEENGVYKIERFVACYPRILQTKALTQARLVKIWEWVSPDGKYLAEIQEVLAEGDQIQKMLIFTK